MTENFLAVDGGATKTLAAVYNSDHEILGLGVSGPSNHRNIGEESAIININSSIEKALASSSLNPDSISQSTFAIAGVKDSDKSTGIVDRMIRSVTVNKKTQLFNDAEAGFFSRFLDGDGIVIAAGTGMIAYGKYQGDMNRTSGWGWFIGDEGGAFYIGRRAISRFSRMSDHRIEYNEQFHKAITEFYGLKKDRDLVNSVYGDRIDIRKIASIAVLIAELANRGNTDSIVIIKEAAREAALSANGLLNSVNREEKQHVSGYGGVFRSGNIYWDTIKSEILGSNQNVEFKDPIFGYHAVTGSILMNLKRLGHDISVKDIDSLVTRIDELIEMIPSVDRLNFLFIP